MIDPSQRDVGRRVRLAYDDVVKDGVLSSYTDEFAYVLFDEEWDIAAKRKPFRLTVYEAMREDLEFLS